jgi:DNA-binding CsgD family transcriptional regulator
MLSITTFLRVRKRLITVLFVAICAFLLTPSRKEVGLAYFPFWFASFMLLFGSQVFWIGQFLDVGARFIPGPRRFWLVISATVLYVFFFFAYSFAPLKMLFTGHIIQAAGKRFYRTLIDGIFSVWLVGSFIGFLLVAFFFAADRLMRSAIWAGRQLRTCRGYPASDSDVVALPSIGRRRLLREMVIAASATPFGAAAYGLLYGRIHTEVTRRRIALVHLPKAFEGFRIALIEPLIVNRGDQRLVVRMFPDSDQVLLHVSEQTPRLRLNALHALGLTKREAEVLAWVAGGKTNRDVAAILNVSPRTVKKHLEHIFQKLGVESRMGAAVRVWEVCAR